MAVNFVSLAKDQLIELFEEVTSISDQEECVVVIFFDFVKAFGSDHMKYCCLN